MCDECLPNPEPRLSRRRTIAVLGGALAGLAVGSDALAKATTQAPELVISPRRAWAGDARPPTRPMAPEDVRFLLVHHTATPNGQDPSEVMRFAYDFHTGPEKGWPDVAYNFFIDQYGGVWEGRAGSLAGPVEASATGGSQGFAQLVCVLGDFTSVLPTEAALASLNRTLAWLAGRYGLDTTPGATTTFVSRGSNRWPAGDAVTANIISGHRDMSATACPGETFYPYLVDNVPAQVHALATAMPAGTTTQPTTTTVASTTTTATAATTTVATTAVPTTTPAPTTAGVPSTTAMASAPTVPVTGDVEAAAPETSPPSTTTTPTPTTADTGAGDPSGEAAWPWFVLGGLVAAVGGASWYLARRDGVASSVNDESVR